MIVIFLHALAFTAAQLHALPVDFGIHQIWFGATDLTDNQR